MYCNGGNMDKLRWAKFHGMVNFWHMQWDKLKASPGGLIRLALYMCVAALFVLTLSNGFGLLDHKALSTAIAVLSLYLLGRLGKLPAYATVRFDSLTGLRNRVGFVQALDHAIADRARHFKNGTAVVILIDVVHFGRVNSTIGYVLGDKLLKLIATRLHALLGPRDCLARINGDEFAFVLTSTAAGYLAICESVVDVFSQPFSLKQGVETSLSCVMGIAICPMHGTDSETLLRNAGTALNMAKKSRISHVVYDNALSQSYIESLSISSALKSALDNDEFILHYQPKLDLRTGKISGVEVLIRLSHPTRGLVYPGEFIALAEQSNMIARLTSWTISEGIKKLAEIRSLGYDITLSINISPYALVASDVLTAMTKEIVYRSIPYRSLIVEITETSIEQSPEEMSRISACLEMLGINISIDDFGTGQSSLLYIKHMPIKELKIDKTFVMNMLSNPADESIVRSTIELAHSLGCEAVAEGVESTDVLDKLSELGCDTVQGYLVSRPLPEADFLEFLEERNGNKKTAG